MLSESSSASQHGPRTTYDQTPFTEDHLVSTTNPFHQFRDWFQEAVSCKDIKQPNAACMSTVSAEGKPSSRMVVMMEHTEEEGFTFYTKLSSRKASQMTSNSEVCLLFHWPPLSRQVKVEGSVSRIGDEKLRVFFSALPRSFQLGALLNSPSQHIANHDELEKMHAELRKQYSDESVEIPTPDHWGAYRVQPRMMEFCQGQNTWVDDRIVFEKADGSDEWTIHRLAP